MSTWAVIVAGGSGERFGARKQFAALGPTSVIGHCIATASRCCAGVVAVVPEGFEAMAPGADVVCTGGTSRSASVRAGLAHVPADCTVVLVHDAARPLATFDLYQSVIEALDDPSIAAAIPGLAIADTVKVVAGSPPHVVSTLDRSTLVTVQTPQGFRADILRQAHQLGGDATDDAALVEGLGATVRIVPGDPRNIKITSPDDLIRVASMLT